MKHKKKLFTAAHHVSLKTIEKFYLTWIKNLIQRISFILDKKVDKSKFCRNFRTFEYIPKSQTWTQKTAWNILNCVTKQI